MFTIRVDLKNDLQDINSSEKLILSSASTPCEFVKAFLVARQLPLLLVAHHCESLKSGSYLPTSKTIKNT